jgi:hypothetical protein
LSVREFCKEEERVTNRWIFDHVPASGARTGGLAQAEVFDKDLDTFVREVLQNACDQRRDDADRVRAKFRLEDLAGAELLDFLQGAGWSQLEPHLDAIADAGYVTISPRVQESLAELRTHDRLRLLRIDDLGTNGLTGGEDEAESNFNALCRHTLITPSGRRESGGSFGLGKSVLWRFSGLSTVLFASGVTGSRVRPRFFGRTLLAWHKTLDGEWEGSGWLGAQEDRSVGSRAISIWDEEAEEAARACRLERDPDEAGTSILIVGFDDPALEEERPIGELCENFVESAARWFWPALEGRQMEVTVEGFDHNEQVFGRQAHASDEIRPFVLASMYDRELVERVAEPGDVAEREITLNVPAQRSSAFEEPRAAAQANALIRLRLAETGEEQLQNRVALQRGTGMVIQYYEPPRRSLVEQAFHASLVVGTGHGDSQADRSAEEFLRAAEPVAHSEWTPTTDRIRAEYAVGAQGALRQFVDDIATSVQEMLREAPADTAEGPDALRKLFPLPGIGDVRDPSDPFRLTDVRGQMTSDSWSFEGTYSRSEEATGEWTFHVGVVLEQESGQRGQSVPINSLEVDGGSARGPDSDGAWEVDVPSPTSEVKFRGQASEAPGLPEGGMRRTSIRLEVRPVLRSAA